jgi:diguanylate cyclase (GGDEF)-like protein
MLEKIGDTLRRSIIWKRVVLAAVFAVQISICVFIVQHQYDATLDKTFLQLQTSAAIQKTLFKDFVEGSAEYLHFVAQNFTGSREQIKEIDHYVKSALLDVIVITNNEGNIKLISSIIDVDAIIPNFLEKFIIESKGYINAKEGGKKTLLYFISADNEDLEGGAFILFNPYYYYTYSESKNFGGVTISVISNKSFSNKIRELKRAGMSTGIDGQIAIVETENDRTLFRAFSDAAYNPMFSYNSAASKQIKANLGKKASDILKYPNYVIYTSLNDDIERVAVSVPFIGSKIFIVSQSKSEVLKQWYRFTGFIFIFWFLSAIAQWFVVNAIHANHKKSARLYEHAFVDVLTGLANRRGFDAIEAKLFSEEFRELGFIFIDLDNFKIANDICGHDFGDAVLVEVAALMNDCVRDSDYTFRFGGDELAIILNKATADTTKMVSEKIRTAIFDADMKIGDSGKQITASIGATAVHRHDKTFDAAIKRADNALYASKANGKNCVSFI